MTVVLNKYGVIDDLRGFQNPVGLTRNRRREAFTILTMVLHIRLTFKDIPDSPPIQSIKILNLEAFEWIFDHENHPNNFHQLVSISKNKRFHGNDRMTGAEYILSFFNTLENASKKYLFYYGETITPMFLAGAAGSMPELHISSIKFARNSLPGVQSKLLNQLHWLQSFALNSWLGAWLGMTTLKIPQYFRRPLEILILVGLLSTGRFFPHFSNPHLLLNCPGHHLLVFWRCPMTIFQRL
jgi:hypothetical protein